MPPILQDLLQRYRDGDRHALARLLTLVARGECVEQIRAGLAAPSKQSRVVALTGSGGVGKSTLIGKLIELIRQQGQTAAVLACDPQSPKSGGALLGDRFRMGAKPDDGVFIRSLATPGEQGAIAEYLDVMIRLLEGFGFDVILLETVGAGQGDTRVRDLADVVVLLLQPEMGDDLQWEKAGVLEVADIVFVHKADLPGAEQVAAQVNGMLGLSGETVPVLRGSAKTGIGLQELWSAISACPLRRQVKRHDQRELLRLAQETLASRFALAASAGDPAFNALVARWQQGSLEREQAGACVLQLLTTRSASCPPSGTPGDASPSATTSASP